LANFSKPFILPRGYLARPVAKADAKTTNHMPDSNRPVEDATTDLILTKK
jgi:hypothetical protein